VSLAFVAVDCGRQEARSQASSHGADLHGTLVGQVDFEQFDYQVAWTPGPEVVRLQVGQQSVGLAEQPQEESWRDVPGPDGRFMLRGIPADPHASIEVRATALGSSAKAHGRVFYEQLAAVERSDGSLTVGLPGHRHVTVGIVGEHVPTDRSVHVSVHGQNGWTTWRVREAGKAEGVLPEGDYVLHARGEGWASRPVVLRLTAAQNPVPEIELKRMTEFTCRLVREDGLPLQDGLVWVGTEESRSLPQPNRLAFALEDGELQLAGLLPGDYDIQFLGLEEFKTQPGASQQVTLSPEGVCVVVDAPRARTPRR
jgi:hypothetical protein